MNSNKTLILGALEVNTIVQTFGLDNLMDLLIARMTQTIVEFAPQDTDIPIRSGFNYEYPQTGLVEMMPVHDKGNEVVIKIVGYHPKNPQLYNIPTILSSISAYDTSTGHLKAVADGVLLTALRTGAASAIASRALALPNSNTLGLIGAGAQAVTQTHAISRLFDIKKVLVFDVDKATLASFKDRIVSLNLAIQIEHATVSTIMAQSDIVCTQTSIDVNEGPLFEDLSSKVHLHVNAIGSDFPSTTELPKSLLLQSLVCPDFLAQAKIEGECQQLESQDIGPDLAALLKHPQKYKDALGTKTVFDSTGWALEDMVIMDLFIELGTKLNIGQIIELENISNDAKNPYAFMDVKQSVASKILG